jgi:ubiquinone/menaquinone biosynthesis C-methylase UbiE
MIKAFIQFNKRICLAVENYFPQSKNDARFFNLEYERLIVDYARQMKEGGVIVDAGGGRSCPFARKKPSNFKITSVDISAEELEANIDVDDKKISDISRHLPFEDSEVDIIASKMVIEHLPQTEGFISESGRVLKAGGKLITVFPSRFAPFALISQSLPHKLSEGLVAAFHPEWVSGGRSGRFRTFYDKCYYSAFKSLLDSKGFRVEKEYITYAQSRYFDFFFPFYILSMTYELLVHTLRLKNLAAYLLIVAQKTG